MFPEVKISSVGGHENIGCSRLLKINKPSPWSAQITIYPRDQWNHGKLIIILIAIYAIEYAILSARYNFGWSWRLKCWSGPHTKLTYGLRKLWTKLEDHMRYFWTILVLRYITLVLYLTENQKTQFKQCVLMYFHSLPDKTIPLIDHNEIIIVCLLLIILSILFCQFWRLKTTP